MEWSREDIQLYATLKTGRYSDFTEINGIFITGSVVSHQPPECWAPEIFHMWEIPLIMRDNMERYIMLLLLTWSNIFYMTSVGFQFNKSISPFAVLFQCGMTKMHKKIGWYMAQVVSLLTMQLLCRHATESNLLHRLWTENRRTEAGNSAHSLQGWFNCNNPQ